MDLVNELIYESNILMKETEPQLLRTSLIELGIVMGCIFIGIFIFFKCMGHFSIFKSFISALVVIVFLIFWGAWMEIYKNSPFSLVRNTPMLILFEWYIILIMVKMVKKHRKEKMLN